MTEKSNAVRHAGFVDDLDVRRHGKLSESGALEFTRHGEGVDADGPAVQLVTDVLGGRGITPVPGILHVVIRDNGVFTHGRHDMGTQGEDFSVFAVRLDRLRGGYGLQAESCAIGRFDAAEEAET